MSELRSDYKMYDGKIRTAIQAIDEMVNLDRWQRAEIAYRLLYVLVPDDTPHRTKLITSLERVVRARWDQSESSYEWQRRQKLSQLDAIGDIPF